MAPKDDEKKQEESSGSRYKSEAEKARQRQIDFNNAMQELAESKMPTLIPTSGSAAAGTSALLLPMLIRQLSQQNPIDALMVELARMGTGSTSSRTEAHAMKSALAPIMKPSTLSPFQTRRGGGGGLEALLQGAGAGAEDQALAQILGSGIAKKSAGGSIRRHGDPYFEEYMRQQELQDQADTQFETDIAHTEAETADIGADTALQQEKLEIIRRILEDWF